MAIVEIDEVCIDKDLWDGFQNQPEVIKKKKEDRISYIFDHIIKDFSREILQSQLNMKAIQVKQN